MYPPPHAYAGVSMQVFVHWRKHASMCTLGLTGRKVSMRGETEHIGAHQNTLGLTGRKVSMRGRTHWGSPEKEHIGAHRSKGFYARPRQNTLGLTGRKVSMRCPTIATELHIATGTTGMPDFVFLVMVLWRRSCISPRAWMVRV